MLNVTIPTITHVKNPIANKVIYNWTPPEPLPEPEEATFNTDGTSCTDSQWFDDESIREIAYRADVDPTVSLQALQIELEFDGETTRYEIVEDLHPHSSSPTCSSVQADAQDTTIPMRGSSPPPPPSPFPGVSPPSTLAWAWAWAWFNNSTKF
jgi:hypothetical protein